jgi:hypothetical protein
MAASLYGFLRVHNTKLMMVVRTYTSKKMFGKVKTKSTIILCAGQVQPEGLAAWRTKE